MLKKTKPFSGEPSPFVMEMPQYHLPKFTALTKSMWERGFSFIKKAGTLITVATILIWFTGSYSFGLQAVDNYNGSILQSIGSVIAIFFKPLGFGNDWASVATVLGLVAKETVVATFGILSGIGEVAGDDPSLLGWVSANMTQISAYSFLIFNLLCAPCFAAIGAIKNEMNDNRWTWFAIVYQTIFAYSISLIFYQFAMLFTGNGNLGGVIFASIVLALMLYMIIRPEPKKYKEQKEVLDYAG
jgi:ferrous iron transport protein B